MRARQLKGGFAFMYHQIGIFLGASGGGTIYAALGTDAVAWRIGVAFGLPAASARWRSR